MIQEFEKRIDKRFDEMRKRFAKMERMIREKIDEAVVTIIRTVDKSKADRIKFEDLERRVEKLEEDFQAS